MFQHYLHTEWDNELLEEVGALAIGNLKVPLTYSADAYAGRMYFRRGTEMVVTNATTMCQERGLEVGVIGYVRDGHALRAIECPLTDVEITLELSDELRKQVQEAGNGTKGSD
jgi:hypothetical protein